MYLLFMLLLITIMGSLTLLCAAWLQVHWHAVAAALLGAPIVLMIFGAGFGLAFFLGALIAMLAMAAYRWQFMLTLWQAWQALPGRPQAKASFLLSQLVKHYSAYLYPVAQKVMPAKVDMASKGQHVLVERLVAAVQAQDFSRASALVNRFGLAGRQSFLQVALNENRIKEEDLAEWLAVDKKQSMAALALCHLLGRQLLLDAGNNDLKRQLMRYKKRLSQVELHPYEAAMLGLRTCAHRSDKILAAYKALHQIAPYNLPAMLLVLERLSFIDDQDTAKKLIQQFLAKANSAPQVYVLPVVWQLHRNQLQLAMVNKCMASMKGKLGEAHKFTVLNYLASAYFLLKQKQACGALIKQIDGHYHAPAWQFGAKGLAALGPEYQVAACLKWLKPAKAKPRLMKKSAQPVHG
ncbi:hypothetical protein [Salinibius halmophilus]|uniref:hypothetical protein n=1 Tax=Salinibius halmophilus TaxID=1853216 RepID=UPI000E67587E|nr:hypothetical protein [Salinibius halmophilus]